MAGSVKKISLDPWFITGFADAESCFYIEISRRSSTRLGWQVRAKFQITLHVRDKALLNLIQSFFDDVGSISIDSKRSTTKFTVSNINDLVNVIIPHFDQYDLQSAKNIDYLLWKQCVILIASGKHLTIEGLEKIVAIKGAINLGLSEGLKSAFSNVVPDVRPINKISHEPLNPNWVSGFFEGDGCVTASISSKNYVTAFLKIELNERDHSLLTKILQFFGLGKINQNKANSAYYYQITKLNSFTTIVIPHFKVYPLYGNKKENLAIWSRIIAIMQSKAHLTSEGLAQIRSLIDQLNK
jgi:hypothetical protein